MATPQAPRSICAKWRRAPMPTNIYVAKDISQLYNADAEKNQVEKNNSPSQEDRIPRLLANCSATVLNQVGRFGWLFLRFDGNSILHLLVSYQAA
jgi:hypothetical protein